MLLYFSALFPFGNRSGDKMLERAIDKAGEAINLTVPFRFYLNKEQKLFVSHHRVTTIFLLLCVV